MKHITLLLISFLLFTTYYSSAQKRVPPPAPPPPAGNDENSSDDLLDFNNFDWLDGLVTDTIAEEEEPASTPATENSYLLDFENFDWFGKSKKDTVAEKKEPVTKPAGNNSYILDFENFDWFGESKKDTVAAKTEPESKPAGNNSYLLDFENFDWNANKPKSDTPADKKEPATTPTSGKSYMLDFGDYDWGTGSTASNTATAKDVTIGSQTWMGKNLAVSTFRNGDVIAEAKTDKEWLDAYNAKKPAWCYYNNDPANGAKYGKLYNWYAVFDPRGLAPDGWKIPTKEDWVALNTALNGRGGQKIKSSTGWKESNEYNNGTNVGNFSALPGGYRLPAPDSFAGIGAITWWWTSTQTRMMGFEMGNGYKLEYDDSELREITPENEGLSVRCVKN